VDERIRLRIPQDAVVLLRQAEQQRARLAGVVLVFDAECEVDEAPVEPEQLTILSFQSCEFGTNWKTLS
jgi:hypothetical protein